MTTTDGTIKQDLFTNRKIILRDTLIQKQDPQLFGSGMMYVNMCIQQLGYMQFKLKGSGKEGVLTVFTYLSQVILLIHFFLSQRNRSSSFLSFSFLWFNRDARLYFLLSMVFCAPKIQIDKSPCRLGL